MNFIRQIFSKSSKKGLKITKVNDDWVVMRDYSIIYVGTKALCKAYVERLAVTV